MGEGIIDRSLYRGRRTECTYAPHASTSIVSSVPKTNHDPSLHPGSISCCTSKGPLGGIVRLRRGETGEGDNPAQGMHASLTEAKIRPKGISPSPPILNGGGQKSVWMDGGRIQACKKIPPGNESNQGPRDPHSMCIVRMEQKRKEKYTHIRQREK